MDTDTRSPLDVNKYLSPEIYGKECSGCHCDLDWLYFRKDSSIRDGHAHLCAECESAPHLSTGEHVAREREKNFNSEGTKKQRCEDQDEYKNDEARIGRAMLSSDFIPVLNRLVPNLYITLGRIKGHLAVFETAPGPQKKWEGRNFKYLFYMEEGITPEFSLYDWDYVRDIRIRERKRGYRTVLLRLIKAKLLTEDTCNKVFGIPNGAGSTIWHKELHKLRNKA